ncbi:MAG: hypothetical protein MOGMAGMI_00650 [Candidatus Omnitrophica bacterium]|nr:hypothetical protein [Candidatus Omnitrophota bacterium]
MSRAKSPSLKVLLMLVLLTVSGVRTAGAADRDVFTTGEDWLERMSVREKLIALLPPSLLMQRFGVELERRPEQYIPEIDLVLESQPQLRGQDVANIFASTVYQLEPANRTSLEAMERYLERRSVVESQPLVPRLRLRPSLERDVTTLTPGDDPLDRQ